MRAVDRKSCDNQITRCGNLVAPLAEETSPSAGAKGLRARSTVVAGAHYHFPSLLVSSLPMNTVVRQRASPKAAHSLFL